LIIQEILEVRIYLKIARNAWKIQILLKNVIFTYRKKSIDFKSLNTMFRGVKNEGSIYIAKMSIKNTFFILEKCKFQRKNSITKSSKKLL
jgi:hypothetical protein